MRENDIILRAEITAIEQFLDDVCAELIEQAALLKPEYPIIACGTLDFLVKILRNEIPTTSGLRGGALMPAHADISKEQYAAFYGQLIFLSASTLAAMPEIPNDKSDMLAVSLVLMDWIMNAVLKAEKLVASAHSMKAGILYEMSFE